MGLEKVEEGAQTMNESPKDGVSVIIPSYGGVGRLPQVFHSLAEQTLNPDLIEIIVVLNGPDDGSEKFLLETAAEFKAGTIRWFRSTPVGASAARNLGLQIAERSVITFVDDDDLLEPGYLAAGYAASADGIIGVTHIADRSESGRVDAATSLALRLGSLAGTTTTIGDHPWILGFNACKFLPTEEVRHLRYLPHLKSGEDLVFFAQLLSIGGLKVSVAPEISGCRYLRTLRTHSVSRQIDSFEFNIRQRLQCIQELQSIVVSQEDIPSRVALEQAQTGFIARYLDTNPGERREVAKEVTGEESVDLDWGIVNRGRATGLVFSYCFPPYSDTSAVVAAKAVDEREIVVDVVLNDLSAIRDIDRSTRHLADAWVEESIVIQAPASFSDWSATVAFASEAVTQASQRSSKKYTTMYTRALWVGSHVAGILYKLENPDIVWTAEFSDPLRTGADGELRTGVLGRDETAKKILRIFETRGLKGIDSSRLFDVVEAATLLLSDEVIFTNGNQREVMLSVYDNDFRRAVMRKSQIRPHPIPVSHAYHAVESNFRPAPRTVSIGYFGNFYPNRGMNDVLGGIATLSPADKGKVRLYVFCSNGSQVMDEAGRLGVSENIEVRPFLPYMEFLNAATRFDVLLVNDLQRPNSMPINPFLPSKLSDYRGSGAAVWGIVDQGSALSRQTLDYRTPVGDSSAVRRTLEIIISETTNSDSGATIVKENAQRW